MRRILGTLVVLCLVGAACGGDDDQPVADAAVDATPPAPDAAPAMTVLEHLVASGGWVRDFRGRDLGCTGCREIMQVDFTRDEECGCFRMELRIFWDVVATDDPMGLADGDEKCHSNFRLQELSFAGIDPLVRSVVSTTVVDSTCGAPPGASFQLVFDGQQRDAAGRPALMALVQFMELGPYGHSTGYPIDETITFGTALPFVRCAEADHVAGRGYCLPTCDWTGADPGRSECVFPPYEEPPYYDTTCQATPDPTTAGDPLIYNGDVADLITGAFLAGATVDVIATANDVVLGSDITAADGKYSISVPTGGLALETYLRTTPSTPGYVTTYGFAPWAIAFDVTSYPRVLPVAIRDMSAAAVGVTLDPAKGTLAIQVNDCATASVQGATIATEPPGTVVYLDVAGNPAPALTSTSKIGQAVVFNVPAGDVVVTVTTADGVVYRPRPARSFADGFALSFRRP